jgi:polar amino acid transport system substrate-binding protein
MASVFIHGEFMVRMRICIAACFALSLASGIPPAWAQAPADPRPVLVLTGAIDTYNTYGPWLALIYTEALGRLGYRLDYRPYPAKRSSMVSDSGESDGEINRVAEYSELHPELVKVPVPHFAIRFSAYAARPLALANGWQALKHTDLRVEYRSGVALPGVQLPLVVPSDRLTVANSALLGLRKLQVGRSDIFVEVESVADTVLASEEFRHTSIRKVALMESAEVHAHLHRRHADLAVRLGQVLADMKREGLIEKYRQQAGMTKQPSL